MDQDQQPQQNPTSAPMPQQQGPLPVQQAQAAASQPQQQPEAVQPQQPAQQQDATEQPLTPPQTPEPQTGNRSYKILIVDDEPDARELFVDMLSSEPNYEVSTAVDGIDALAKSEATKFDMVLLDIVMPNKDGVQTLTELIQGKEKYGTPTVIMLTNLGGDLAVEEAMNIGAVDYKVKIDTEPDDLLKTVKEHLPKT
jgi:CheY-like chemotaxis protein